MASLLVSNFNFKTVYAQSILTVKYIETRLHKELHNMILLLNILYRNVNS